MNKREYWNKVIEEFASKRKYVVAGYCNDCPHNNISDFVVYDDIKDDPEHYFRWFFGNRWTGECEECRSKSKYWQNSDKEEKKLIEKALKKTQQLSLFGNEWTEILERHKSNLEFREEWKKQQVELKKQWDFEREWRERYKKLSWQYNVEIPFDKKSEYDNDDEEDNFTEQDFEELE